MRTNGETNMARGIVASCNFVNVPKNDKAVVNLYLH